MSGMADTGHGRGDLLAPNTLPSRECGYHVTRIERGELGEISKIQEELDELKDAALQEVAIMELVELSDLVGAIRCYLERHHPGTSLDDLIMMNAVTQRAFENGTRKPR